MLMGEMLMGEYLEGLLKKREKPPKLVAYQSSMEIKKNVASGKINSLKISLNELTDRSQGILGIRTFCSDCENRTVTSCEHH